MSSRINKAIQKKQAKAIEEIKMGISMMQPSLVEVEPVQLGEVDKQYEFSGRVEAKYSVDLIARVQGFLQKSYFKEGDFVNKGDTLITLQNDELSLQINQLSSTVSYNENKIFSFYQYWVNSFVLMHKEWLRQKKV
mgnify:CR=1 FL=1